MSTRKFPTLLLAALLATTVALTGCTSTASSTSKAGTSTTTPNKATAAAKSADRDANWSEGTGTQYGGTAKAAAPKPAAKPVAAKPAAKPAQVTTDGDMNWGTMNFPTGNATTSAVSVRKGVPREVILNSPFEYMITVTNLTDMSLDNVIVSDQADAGFRVTGSAPQGQGGPDGYTWNLGTMGPNETRTIRVNGTATREGTISSCATVEYSSALCATIPVVQPKLSITKSGPAEVLKCEDIVYKIEVRNSGSGSVQNVRIKDELPAGLTTKDGKRTVDMAVGTLAPGQSRAFNVTAQANKAGSFSNKATASGSNNLTATSNTVTTVVRQPKLTITKTCEAREFIGRSADFTITVKNTGDGVARDTVIEDVVPSGARFVSASDGGRLTGNRVVWNAGTLQPNASKTVSVVMTRATSGTLRNTASARAFCADAVTDSCETVFAGIPAILLEVIDVEDPIEVGDTETYVITATNQGSAPDTNIAMTITLESNWKYVSSTGATVGTISGNTLTFAPLKSLAAKQKAEWRVIVRAVSEGDTRFKVTMNTDELKRPVEETEATNVYK